MEKYLPKKLQLNNYHMKANIIKIVSILVAFQATSFLTLNNPKVFATFRAVKMCLYSDTTLFTTGFTAFTSLFENPPLEGINPYRGTQDGIVKLNSKPLFFNQTIKMYMDSVVRNNLDTVNWKITNSADFNGLNYTTTKPIPNFSNIKCIPNKLCKNNDYVMNFGNVAGVDKIEFTIDNGQLFTAFPFYRKVPSNIGCITIPKLHLACLNVNNPTFVKVTFINEEGVIFGNKKYIFENRLEIRKQITLTN